jgi:hypothetical protein
MEVRPLRHVDAEAIANLEVSGPRLDLRRRDRAEHRREFRVMNLDS